MREGRELQPQLTMPGCGRLRHNVDVKQPTVFHCCLVTTVGTMDAGRRGARQGRGRGPGALPRAVPRRRRRVGRTAARESLLVYCSAGVAGDQIYADRGGGLVVAGGVVAVRAPV